MSGESLAAFRKHAGNDYRKLAEEHMKHDLQQSDRDLLQTAAKKFGTYATIGSLIGIGAGLALAFRFRAKRVQFFQAVRAAEKPTHVQFADGRTEPLPDMTPFLRPTLLGDVATYTLFSAGGLFVFGELGFLAGSYSASKTITNEPEAKKRIETAFKRFRVDALKQQAKALEASESELLL